MTTIDPLSSQPLKAELPELLLWLEDDVRALQRQTAEGKRVLRPLKPGATRRGHMDVPADADWVRELDPYCHYADGMSIQLQLNLADIPDAVRKPEWPREGVVWVFLQWGHATYAATAKFDPRPAETIPWADPSGGMGHGIDWELHTLLPWCTPHTLPLLAHWPDVRTLYDDWVEKHYLARRGRSISLGGWGFPIQDDFDERNEDLVCSIDDIEFGDAGALYLHFNAERGFYALADTH